MAGASLFMALTLGMLPVGPGDEDERIAVPLVPEGVNLSSARKQPDKSFHKPVLDSSLSLLSEKEGGSTEMKLVAVILTASHPSPHEWKPWRSIGFRWRVGICPPSKGGKAGTGQASF